MSVVHPNQRITLFTGVKNEAPFLLEWIGYHKAIGFNDFIVVSNDCTDGTSEILDALDAAGEIRHVPQVIPPDSAPQRNAAKIITESGMMNDSDWFCWIDADEFVNVRVGDGSVHALIDAIGDKAGMLIHWRIFGDSHNEKFPGRYVSSEFTHASKRKFPTNAEIKSFFRVDESINGLGQICINRPQLRANARTTDDFIVSDGSALNPRYEPNVNWVNGRDNADMRLAQWKPRFNRTWPSDGAGVIAQINHYCVRTPEFYALKGARGRGWALNGHIAKNNRHNTPFYEKMNKNDEIDTSILRFGDKTTEEINRLMQYEDVAAAVRLSQKHVQAELEALMPKPTQPEVATSDEDLYGTQLMLPEDSAALVRKVYAENKNILEYGSGGSTALALSLGADRVVAVESDKAWADDMTAKLSPHFAPERFLIHHADIGKTKDWGRPRDAKAFRRFHRYPAEVWDTFGDWHPDVVFIDGRFRAGCFITTMIKIKRPTTVLFDDYVDRPHYHGVEEYAKPVETAGRLVRFELEPRAFPIDQFTHMMSLFIEPD